jgi:hypothetical protein
MMPEEAQQFYNKEMKIIGINLDLENWTSEFELMEV